MNKRLLSRLAIGTGVLVLLPVAFMGVAHTKWGRPLLALTGKCPVPHASVAEVQTATMKAITADRGKDAAPARPAFGFELDKMTLADVHAWEKKAQISCRESREGTVITCANVTASVLPSSFSTHGTIDELIFGFRVDNKTLFSVDVFQAGKGEDNTQKDAVAVTAALAKELGAPQTLIGTPETSGGRKSIYIVKYKFRDLLVDYLITPTVEGGSSVRERYISAVGAPT